jgi:hypothetical protein
MKTYYRLFVWLFIAVFTTSLTGCKDDDPVEPSIEDLLTADEWIGNSIYAKGENITELIINTEGFDIRYIKIRFSKDGTFKDDNNGLQSTGTWKYIKEEQEIILDEGTPREWHWTLSKITKSELYLVDKFSNGKGEMIEAEMRFNK